jgi:hypothetical protein
MKSFLRIFTAVVCMLLFTSSFNAQPIAGLELSLTSLGAYDYETQFIYYRDCSAIAAPATVTLQFQCPSNTALNFNVSNVPKISSQEVTPVCPGTLTYCAGGTLTGYQANVYETQVTLPPCSNWVVSTSLCCRALSQTAQTAGQSGYIQASLNNLDAPFNSSPLFTNNPVTMMCAGQENIINHGAVDPDGDSLSYSMANPWTSSIAYVSWNIPYSPTQPLMSNPPVSLNPVTGELKMKPTSGIVSLMLLRVDQWRTVNGVPMIVGTNYRDVKLNAGTCNNQLPLLSGLAPASASGYNPADTIFHRDVCIGDTVNFAIHGYDADTANATIPGNRENFNISWNHGIPQASLQVFHQDSDSAWALFSWVPAATDRGKRCFTVSIHDYACPYNGVQTYTYCLNVGGIAAFLNPDTAVCLGEMVNFSVTTNPPAADFLWTIDGLPVLTPAPTSTLTVSTAGMTPGVHIVRVEAIDGNPAQVCTGTAQSAFTIYPAPSVSLGNDTTLATGANILLDAGPGFIGYTWSTGQSGQFITVDSSGTGSGTKIIWVKVIDIHGCTAADTVLIHFVHNPGMEQPTSKASLRLVPNPTEGVLSLHLKDSPPGEYQVEIFSRDGKMVFTEKVSLTGKSDAIPLNLEHLTDGFYTLSLKGAGFAASEKFIVQRFGKK